MGWMARMDGWRCTEVVRKVGMVEWADASWFVYVFGSEIATHYHAKAT